jgi:hypothetical protein
MTTRYANDPPFVISFVNNIQLHVNFSIDSLILKAKKDTKQVKLVVPNKFHSHAFVAFILMMKSLLSLPSPALPCLLSHLSLIYQPARVASSSFPSVLIIVLPSIVNAIVRILGYEEEDTKGMML